MKILIINPNTSEVGTKVMDGVAKKYAAASTQITISAPRGRLHLQGYWALNLTRTRRKQ